MRCRGNGSELERTHPHSAGPTVACSGLDWITRLVRHERADLSSATDLHRRRTLSGAVYRATIALGLLLPAPLHTSRRLKYSPPERPELRGDSARTCTGLVASNRHSIG